MKIVTAANRRMRQFAWSCVKSAQKLGYEVIVYDLGGLGFGIPFPVENLSFQKNGHYRQIINDRYALGNHKPEIIRDCLHKFNELVIYLDADTIMLDRIDEMAGDYDVGLTVRPEWEVEKVTKKLIASDYFIYNGFINIGVMSFNPTKATDRFLDRWEQKIKEVHDDQGAINVLLQRSFPLKSNQIIEMEGVKIRTFDTARYNHYYFRWPKIYKSLGVDQEDIKIKWPDAKILHFKGDVRSEYFRIFHPFRDYFSRAINGLIKILNSKLK